jgi:hypothetical protein
MRICSIIGCGNNQKAREIHGEFAYQNIVGGN